jgi:SAM-dependent methyltransferase
VTEHWYETAFGSFYPVLYGHRDDAEAVRCLRLLARLCPLNGPVLDLGCGEGRHLALLDRPDRPAVGLDLSADLLRGARRRAGGRDLRLVRGDMRCLPCAGGAFGTVVSLFTAFGYFAGRAANAVPVQEIARVLVPDGHWCLDYFDADRLRKELAGNPAAVRERRAGPLAVREIRVYDEARSLVRKSVEMSVLPGREEEAAALGCGPDGIRYGEEVAVFTLDEIDAMAGDAGLARVAGAGDYAGAPLGAGDRWLLVYRRRSGGGGS